MASQPARPQDRNSRDSAPTPDFGKIKFGKPLNAELFNGVAQEMARNIANADRNANKSTQLRRFFDEIVLWENRMNQVVAQLQGDKETRANLAQEKFEEFLPFIRMINAKAAYAQGRRLVDPAFVGLVQHTLKQVVDAETLSVCKLFWEAFMGFYKQERQD